MEKLKKDITADIINKHIIAKMVTAYFEKVKRVEKRKVTTSYMCWLKDNRNKFEICDNCSIPAIVNENGKKVCPQCDSKIKATKVAQLAGLAWKEVPQDIKLAYTARAKALNQKNL